MTARINKSDLTRLPKRSKKVVYRMQSIRIPASDNLRLRACAKRQGISFNKWALDALLRELEREGKKQKLTKPRIRPKLDAEVNGDAAATG